MKALRLYHGGQIEVRDVAGGAGFVLVVRDETETLSLRLERLELGELVSYLNNRRHGATSDEPSALDIEGGAAMEAAAAREREASGQSNTDEEVASRR